MEAHKNAIVKDMLAKVKPYVDHQGRLLHDPATLSIPAGWVELCRSEQHQPIHKILLLTIMANRVNDTTATDSGGGWRAMAGSRDLLAVLESWFKAAVTEYTTGTAGQPVLLGKLVDLLNVLPLELNTLLEFKFGRVLKKLVHFNVPPEPSGLEKEMLVVARSLFTRWSAMADEPSSVVEPLVDPSAHDTTTTATTTATHNDIVVPVGRAMLIHNNTITATTSTGNLQPQQAQQAQQSTRPLSADDIHKERKRRAYLESIGVKSSVSSTDSTTSTITYGGTTTTAEQVNHESDHHHPSIPGLTTTVPQPPHPSTTDKTSTSGDGVRKKKAKVRRVSFPEDPALLVQIRLFASDELDDHNTTDDDVYRHYGQEGEASFAFDRLRQYMEAECEWTRPPVVAVTPTTGSAPYKGQFAMNEAERVKKTLSVDYSTKSRPADPHYHSTTIDHAGDGNTTRTAVIPVRDVHNTMPMKRHLPPPSSSPHCDTPSNPNNNYNTTTSSTSSSNTNSGSVVGVSPEMLSALLQDLAGIIPPPPPTAAIPPPPPTQPQQPHQHQHQQSQSHNRKRVRPACKFFRPGVPGSCRSGPACPFRHGDG